MQRICYFPFIPLSCIKWFTACYRGWEPRFKTQRQAVGLRQGLFLIRNCVSTACTLALRFNVLITKEFFCIWVRIMAASSRKTVLELAFSEVCSSTMTTFYIVIKHSFTEFDAMANKLNFVLGMQCYEEQELWLMGAFFCNFWAIPLENILDFFTLKFFFHPNVNWQFLNLQWREARLQCVCIFNISCFWKWMWEWFMAPLIWAVRGVYNSGQILRDPENGCVWLYQSWPSATSEVSI